MQAGRWRVVWLYTAFLIDKWFGTRQGGYTKAASGFQHAWAGRLPLPGATQALLSEGLAGKGAQRWWLCCGHAGFIPRDVPQDSETQTGSSVFVMLVCLREWR